MPTGLQPPDPILAGSPGGETLRIADSQANLCWAIFGQLLAGVIVALFPRVGILGAIIGIFTVCIAYSCYRALFGAVAAVFLSILTLFPCVGLVVLLIANSTATSRLRAAGLHVGFMGVSATDRDTLRHAAAHDAVDPLSTDVDG